MEDQKVYESAELDLGKVKVQKGKYSLERWNRVWDKILAEDPPSSKLEDAGETKAK